MPVSTETIAVAIATPADGPSFGRRAFRHVDVDVALVEQRRLDAEIDGARADVGRRRRDRFLHHFLQVAGHRHAALAGHHDAFDRQQLAADLGPGKAGDHADLIVGLDLAVAEARHAEIVRQVVRRDLHRLRLLAQDLGHRLAPELHQLALEVADAGFARVGLDDRPQRVVADRKLLRLQGVVARHLRHQVPLGDLDLLVLGVAGDADDLHAVHQRPAGCSACSPSSRTSRSTGRIRPRDSGP